MPTIKDVAKYAGLSVGTVSNVLNGLDTVSQANREKVNQAIEALGYRKNHAASELRSNKSNAIGLIIPDITNPFYPEIARGVEDMARKSGYNVFLCNKDRLVQRERQVLTALLEKNVDGILLFKPHLSAEQIREIHAQCALVLIDASQQESDCDTVNVSDYQGMQQAVERTIALGHSRIAFIAGLKDSFSSKRRLDAYRDALKAHGIARPKEYVQYGDYSVQSGMRLAMYLMKLPAPPTVIMTANDMMALGALSAAEEMGLKVPQDLSVVGYDDVQSAAWAYPRLTTTWHPKYELGEQATQMLLDQIRLRRIGKPEMRQHITMMTEFRMRDSLGEVKQETDE